MPGLRVRGFWPVWALGSRFLACLTLSGLRVRGFQLVWACLGVGSKVSGLSRLLVYRKLQKRAEDLL